MNKGLRWILDWLSLIPFVIYNGLNILLNLLAIGMIELMFPSDRDD